jgi:ankyrin repeat protein
MRNCEIAVVFKWVACLVLALTGTAWGSSFDDFFTAVKKDDAAAVRALAQRGFDLNTRNAEGEHGLYLAIRDEAPQVTDFLLSQSQVEVEARTAKDESPLMIAAIKGRLDLAKRLIERKAEVNKTGWTPLHYAATHAGDNSAAMVRLLLEHHAYIDAESPNKTTPLMMAAQYGNAGVVKLLLEEGADPLLKNQLGLTAIDFARRANRQASADIIAAFVRAQQPKGKW